MPRDKSLSYYGWLYNKLFDPPLLEAREVVANLVVDGSSVIDIGCGTGLLSFALSEKRCRVLGVDLSLQMLQFAEKNNVCDDVTFRHLDATDLAGIADRSFDYATVLFLLHELGREKQLQVLSEAARVARKIILVDSCVPLPWNLNGLALRAVEATFGIEHNPNFRRFLAGGGIPALVEAWGRNVNILHRFVFWRGCREVVMLSQAVG